MVQSPNQQKQAMDTTSDQQFCSPNLAVLSHVRFFLLPASRVTEDKLKKPSETTLIKNPSSVRATFTLVVVVVVISIGIDCLAKAARQGAKGVPLVPQEGIQQNLCVSY